MEPRALQNIAIVLTSPFMYLMRDLARLIKARHNCRIHLYCHGPDHAEFFRREDVEGLFASVQDYWIFHAHFRDPVIPPREEIFENARRWEHKYGITISQIAMGSTHFGYQYSLAGFYVRRMPLGQETNYDRLLHLYNLNFAFWEKEIAEKNISMILGGASIPNEVMVVAEHHRIPLRAATVSRFGNLHYWAQDRFFDTPDVLRELPKIQNPDPSVAERLSSYLLYRVGSNQFILDNTSVVQLARNVGRFTAQWLYSHVRNRSANRNIYYWEIISTYLRTRRTFQKELRKQTVQAHDLAGEQYVFFPLQVEPESSMGMMSPEFFTQQFAIAMLARDLPAGTKLVVKEHYVAFGRRPRDFYDQLRDIKNLVFADPRQGGLEFIANAKVVATFSGTPGFEAAIMGKPVVTFCRHNLYNIIPHVHVVKDPADLTGIMWRLFNEPHDAQKAKQEGARFLEAVIRTSYDLGQFNQVDLKSYTQEAVQVAYDALLGSLKNEKIAA